MYGELDFLGTFLEHTSRDDFIVILHALDDYILQRVEILRVILSTMGVANVKSFSYLSPATPIAGALNRDIPAAMNGVHSTGYRTIIFMTAHPDVDSVHVGKTASELGMDQGDHFWILAAGRWIDSLSLLNVVQSQDSQEDDATTVWWKFLQGAAYLDHVDRFQAVPNDPFNKSFHFQNASFVEELRSINPIPNYTFHEWVHNFSDMPFPTDDIFQNLYTPFEGCSYMYDAVVSIGLGACIASAERGQLGYNVSAVTDNETTAIALSGDDLLAGIQSVEFTGASGAVRFGAVQGIPGSRDARTVYFGVFNLVASGLLENRYVVYLRSEASDERCHLF